ncbi:TetR/AcrR family transcriptional regulator [Paenibacillus sp. Marseille-Q4541]|uniref:TetR/AcrR family transcriptional regulator n=1 Tax=Paenibacillus sp. Marseille-Q4541 TaxID=2831522 RepID=UPI001BA9A7BD|nr:TetR/AcrR family transcriptional regulator [Paenibacillus sp. Marseille-Q4541]
MTSTKWSRELEQQREKRRTELLEASRKLFLEKDLHAVTMRDIAAEVGISTVTLYKYYKSIDVLAFEVLLQLFEEMKAFFQVKELEEGDPLKRIELFLGRFHDYLYEKPDHLRFQAMFDHYYRKEYPQIDQVNLFRDRISNDTLPLLEILEKAQQDGMARTDYTAEELTSWMMNLLMAMSHRLASRGHLLEQESKLSTEGLMKVTREAILQYIKKPNDTE